MTDEIGKLYIVATPIGNLADITFRAIDILKSVDVILCEDTRTTGHLLKHYAISTPTKSFHSHSKLNKVSEIKNMIAHGKHLALVSDAGTPCISDPGVMLVAELRKTFGDAIIVSPIPGPSALIAALSVSGMPSHEFTWLGFVPHKKGRETFFKTINDISHTVVFYESVHRITKTLEALTTFSPERPITIARELTKLFETVSTKTAAEHLTHFETYPETVRGEFVVIVGPSK